VFYLSFIGINDTPVAPRIVILMAECGAQQKLTNLVDMLEKKIGDIAKKKSVQLKRIETEKLHIVLTFKIISI
jgi:hypothetical protein